MALKLNVIVVSTRPGRVGPKVGAWMHRFAADQAGFEAELVDLDAFALPVFDEPKHPRLQDYQHSHTHAWSASVASADAFVFVSPEYNYMPPPSFVNAVDFLFREWNYEVAGLVTYGGALGGARAAQMEKLMLTSVKVMTVPEGVSIPLPTHMNDKGEFNASPPIEVSAKAMLEEMVKWAGALKPLRAS
jgi:NAD(P)H-dependent FMN reductase